jgi:outer membrane protein TolC
MRTSIFSFVFAAAIYAQPVQTLELSLSRAVEIALSDEGSTKIALAEESIVRAETQVRQAKSALLPTVDASFQERNLTTNLKAFGFSFDFPGFSIPSVVGPFNVIDTRANVRWTILDFASLRRYRAVQANVDASKADLNVTRTQVADQVARAYLAALRADAALEAAQANVDLSWALVDLAQSQKEAGTGTGIEVTRAQVQLANDRGRLTIAENERSRTGLQLLRAMGLDLSVPVHLSGKLEYVPVENGTAEASLSMAKADRVELKAQHQRETVAQLNTSATDAERLPSVSTFGDYGGIGKPSLGLERTHTVGVTVTVPIFDGGHRQARRAESNTLLRTEQLRTRDLEEQIELEVRLALNSLRSAQTQVETARQGLALAQDEVEQAQRRYRAGVAVPLEITDAQARLDRARDNQILALYTYNLARLDLAVATGHIQEFVQ